MLLAHAFGQRYDLPVPLFLFVVGGAFVVVLSFVLVLHTDRGARADASPEPSEQAPPLPGRSWPGWVAVAVLAFGTWCGFAGSDEIPENILPTAFWLVVWIVVPLSCGLLGDWTRPVNPYLALARAVDRPGVRKAVLARAEPLTWRAGYWVAAVLLLGLASCELIYNLDMTRPASIATLLTAYVAVDVVAALLFGRAWVDKGEVFAVLFATWGTLGRWRFGAEGETGLAGGLRGRSFDRSWGRVAFVLLLLVNVSFDGLLSTPTWARLERGDTEHQQWALRQPSFLALVLVTGLVFAGFAVASARVGGFRTTPRDSLVGLLPSLLPIAFGYLVAHNAQYVLVNSQLLAPLIGNPTGLDSWPVHLPYPFNDDYEVHPLFLPSSFYWYVGVLAIVGAHVVAVVLAHRHLVRGAATEQVARRREYPWLVAMVAYTVVSLVLIAQPLVEQAPAGSPGTQTTASVAQ